MNRHFLYKGLALVCGTLLIATTLLTGCKSKPSQEGHDHNPPVAIDVDQAAASDGTFTLTIKDCQGTTLFAKEGLFQKAVSEPISDSVFSISWILNNNPGGFETIYIDRARCLASDVIAGEQSSDGVRVLYAEKKDGVLTAIIRDLFDKEGFCEEHALSDAYLESEYSVIGSRMVGEDTASLAYLVDATGAHRNVTFDLYSDGKPTQKTEATKATEQTKKTEKTEAKKTEKTEK